MREQYKNICIVGCSVAIKKSKSLKKFTCYTQPRSLMASSTRRMATIMAATLLPVP